MIDRSWFKISIYPNDIGQVLWFAEFDSGGTLQDGWAHDVEEAATQALETIDTYIEYNGEDA